MGNSPQGRSPFAFVREHLTPFEPQYWLMMQIAMICGYATTFPMNRIGDSMIRASRWRWTWERNEHHPARETPAHAVDFSHQSRTRNARSVFHRLGWWSPSSSSKWTLPGCVFSSSQTPEGWRLDRSKSIASFTRESGASPTERKYSSPRSTS